MFPMWREAAAEYRLPLRPRVIGRSIGGDYCGGLK